MDGIRCLGLADVIALHQQAMVMADQPPADLVGEDGLESAIAQARQVAWYTEANPAELAVHLTTHIAMARPFVDGNKRTASYAGLQVLAQNGARDPEPGEMISFADLLLKYIEAGHDQREEVFVEFVRFVETWFP